MRGRLELGIAAACAFWRLCRALPARRQLRRQGNIDSRYGVSPSARLVAPGEPVPKGGGVYRVGSPYMVGGRVYVPQDDPNYSAVAWPPGTATIFTAATRRTARFSTPTRISAAHPTLPLPSYVRVTNLEQWPLDHRAGQRPRALCASTASSTSRCGRPIFLASPIAASPGYVSNMSGARRSRAPTTACWRRRCGRTSRRRRHGTCGLPQAAAAGFPATSRRRSAHERLASALPA